MTTLSELRQRQLLDREGKTASSMEETLLFLHPRGTPERIPGGITFLLNPPSIDSSTARWASYHEKFRARAEADPTDLQAAALAEAAKKVLDWRASIPEHLRFWLED